MAKVCIIVLNWNGKEDTRKCLESLAGLEADILIVDNGSEDGSQELFKTKFPSYPLIETNHNLGYAGGNNVGLEYALKQKYEYILLLNNDTIVDPQIVEAFLEGFREYPSAGILGGKIYLMDEPIRIDHFGGMWNRRKMEFDFFGWREEDLGQFTKSIPLDYVCGAAVMIKKEVLEKIGLFDPRFFLFWEEADLCFRARNAGYEVRTCPDAKLWHKVSASFVGGKPHASYFVHRNRLLWVERNFNGIVRTFALFRIIGSQLLFFNCLKAVRSMQLLLQIVSKKETRRNRERIIRYNAVLSGTWDYLTRRFGSGRSKNFINCL